MTTNSIHSTQGHSLNLLLELYVGSTLNIHVPDTFRIELHSDNNKECTLKYDTLAGSENDVFKCYFH